VVVHIALWTKVSLLSNTIELGQFRRHFGTILTIWRLGDQLLMGINREIHQIHREDLIILIHHILVLVELDVFLLVIQVDRLEPLRQRNNVVHELLDGTAVGFTHSNFV
jgi:hypothetical protein